MACASTAGKTVISRVKYLLNIRRELVGTIGQVGFQAVLCEKILKMAFLAHYLGNIIRNHAIIVATIETLWRCFTRERA